MWKTASTHGLKVGLILVGVALLAWIGGFQEARLMRYLNMAIVIGSIYYFVKSWRDDNLGGIMSYGQAVGFGVLLMFFASILLAFFMVIYLNYLDPESVQRMLELAEVTYYDMGWSEDRIEMSMELLEQIQTPFFHAISTVISKTFQALLISLIIALFLRKEGDPFHHAMKDVPEPSNDTQQNEIE